MLRSLVSSRLSVAFKFNDVSSYKVTTMNSSTNQPGEMPFVVSHDKESKQFYIQLRADDGEVCAEKAVLDYDWIKPGFADLYHTEVPTSFRGKGIAKHLAQTAFDYIVAVDGKMRLTCTYLQKYLNDNPIPEYLARTDSDSCR